MIYFKCGTNTFNSKHVNPLPTFHITLATLSFKRLHNVTFKPDSFIVAVYKIMMGIRLGEWTRSSHQSRGIKN